MTLNDIRHTSGSLMTPKEDYKDLKKDYEDNYSSSYIKYQCKGLSGEHFCFSQTTVIEDA